MSSLVRIFLGVAQLLLEHVPPPNVAFSKQALAPLFIYLLRPKTVFDSSLFLQPPFSPSANLSLLPLKISLESSHL